MYTLLFINQSSSFNFNSAQKFCTEMISGFYIKFVNNEQIIFNFVSGVINYSR